MQDSSHNHGNSEDELKLIAAVKRGDVLSVQNLLQTVDSIDFENDQGLTPLIEACTNNHLEIIELLLERGADCNFRNRKVPSPLNLVARKGPDQVDVARLLIDHGAEVDVQDHQGLTSLHWACGRGDLEVTRLLINHGADIHIKNPTPLTLAWTSGNLEVAKVLIEHGGDINARINNDTIAPLHRACMQGCMELASFLIENGADVHVKSIEGKTPLQVALESGRSWDDPLSQNYRDTVKLLVDNGADVLANFNDGRTPLHWALERRLFSFWLVEFLIENGADLHTADNDGKTLLHKVCVVRPWNAKQTNFDAAKLLIERGVNVNGKDGAGETPLHVACRRGEIKLVQLLLTRGVTVNEESNHGYTPLHVACQENHREIVWFLVRQYPWLTAELLEL